MHLVERRNSAINLLLFVKAHGEHWQRCRLCSSDCCDVNDVSSAQRSSAVVINMVNKRRPWTAKQLVRVSHATQPLIVFHRPSSARNGRSVLTNGFAKVIACHIVRLFVPQSPNLSSHKVSPLSVMVRDGRRASAANNRARAAAT